MVPYSVLAAPANDTIATAQSVTGATGIVTGNNAGATREVGEPNHAGLSSNTSVWFKWTAPGYSSVAFDTLGSSFDTLLAVYKPNGSPVAANDLTLVASNDDSNEGFTSRVVFTSVPGQVYYLAVAGYANTSGALTLNWKTSPSNDAFAAAEAISGLTGTLSRSNFGARTETDEPQHGGDSGASVWFRWIAPESSDFTFDTIGSNFNTLLGVYTATSSPAWVYALETIGADDNGGGKNTSRVSFTATSGKIYYIAVAGVSSAQGAINLNWALTPPPNDDLLNAADLTWSSGPLLTANKGATAEWGEPEHDGTTPSRSLWYRWQPGVSQKLTFDTVGSTVDTVLAVYALADPQQPVAFNNLTPLASDDDSGGGSASRVRFLGDPSATYYLAVDTYGAARGTVALNWAINPSNDDFWDAELLSFESGSLATTNLTATKEPGEPNHAGILGGKSVWFHWIAPANGRLTVTAGSSDMPGKLDTLLAVYTGDSLETLTPVAGGGNDNISTTDLGSRAIVSVTKNTTYFIAVDGKKTTGGVAGGAIAFGWSFVYSAPPNNTFVSAQSLTGASGTSGGTLRAATLESGEPKHAGQTGYASVWYRWTPTVSRRVTFQASDALNGSSHLLLGIYRANTPTAPAVNALTGVARATSEEAASFIATASTPYYIAVATMNNPTDYPMGEFSLKWATAPANDDVKSAQVVSGANGSVTGTNVGASAETSEPNHYYEAKRSAWFRWVAPSTGTFFFDTTGSNFDTALAIYQLNTTVLSFANLTAVASDADSGPNSTSRAGFAATSGKTYFIAVDGSPESEGDIALQWYAAPANDHFESARSLSGNSGTWNGSSKGATAQSYEPEHAGHTPSRSLWFRWTPTVSGYGATFTTAGSHFDTALAVYTGETIDALTAIASDENGSASQVAFNPIAGQTYFIAVDGINGAEGTGQLRWSFNPTVGPTNDLFANATDLSGVSGTALGGNLRTTANESGEPLHAGNTGGASIWYRWRAPASGQVSLDTSGSAINTLLSVYTGNSLSVLAKIAANDDIDGTNSASLVTFTVGAGTLYYVAVDGKNTGAGAAKGDVQLNWNLTPTPATITSVSPSSGAFSTRVTLRGTNLWGVQGVQFNGVSATFNQLSGSVVAIVPDGATTGKITISTSYGDATSAIAFTVTSPLVTGMSPGSAGVGAVVTLTGANFTGVSAIKFNDLAAGPPVSNLATATSGFQIVSPTQIKVKVPAGATSGPISVINSGGIATTGAFAVLPVLSTLSPSSSAGLSVVTLTGTSFRDVSAVTFNGVLADFIVNSPTQITATVPATATSGSVRIVAAGYSSNALPFTITTPVLRSFTPLSGPAGTLVTITGANFLGSNLTGVTAVKFNNISAGAAVTDITKAASGFQIVSSTQIKVKVPAAATTGVVSLTNSGGTVVSDGNFTVLPLVSGFSPASGGVGTTVVVTGANFDGISRVDFNGTSASFVVNSPTQLTAMVPPGATTGPLTLSISGRVGTGASRSSSSFTVTSPRITTFSPTSGATSAIVTISGTNFTGATAVKFNGVSAGSAVSDIASPIPGFQVVSDTQIKVKVPAGITAGPISITTAGGTVTTSTNFTPTSLFLASFSPSGGPVGTSVILKGSGFSSITGVKFNGVAANGYTVNSPSQITAKVAAGTTTGKISVTSAAAIADSASQTFVVSSHLPPVISRFDTSSGAVGTMVTVTGANFTTVSAIKFNGINAGSAVPDIAQASSGFQIVSDTQVKVKVPVNATTGVVSFTNHGGTTTTGSAFTVLPLITSFAPTSGGAGTLVTINGSTFADVVRVDFNGVQAHFILNSSAKITATVPLAATTGPLKLTTSSASGSKTTTTNALFTVTSPLITAFSPATGAVGSLVTLSGSNFTGVTAVKFNGVSAGVAVSDITTATSGFQVVSDTQIKVKVPASVTAGFISVTKASVTAFSAASFGLAPVISSLTPARGGEGTIVSLQGNFFSRVNAVQFNGVAASYVVNSPTQITATAPVDVATGRVTVTTATGSGNSPVDFVAAPLITTVSPQQGKPGDIIVLEGSNFALATSVTFNGITAGHKVVDIQTASSGFQVVSPTQILVRVPTLATTGLIGAVNAAGTPSLSGLSRTLFEVAPRISSFTPTSGGADVEVVLTGANFTTTNSVLFVGNPAQLGDDKSATFTVVSDTQLKVRVPANTYTGPIQVTNGASSSLSATFFTAAPRISSFSPSSGAAGTSITISGANLAGVSAVTFNGVAASGFQVNTSGTQITVLVPAGNTSGKITVLTPAGSAQSTLNFVGASTLNQATGPVATSPGTTSNGSTGTSAATMGQAADPKKLPGVPTISPSNPSPALS